MNKLTSTLIIFFLYTSQFKAQILLKLYKDTLYNYEYAGGDEFNSEKLNDNYWTNGLGWTRVLMSQDLSFNPNNVIQENGLLKLIAKKEDSLYVLGQYEIDSSMLKRKEIVLDSNRFLTKYSAGCIISKSKMHYGLYELRFKVEEGQGIWPAFWFFGGNKNEEIDAFELKCEKRKLIHADTHCPYGCDRGYTDKFSFSKNWGGWLPVNEALDKDYNMMVLEWQPELLNWYFNGYPLAYFKGQFSNPMNLYLNTSVAKDGGPFKPGPNANTKWPNTYSVDFIRIWKLNSLSDTLELKAGDLNDLDSSYANRPLKKGGLTFKKQEFKASKAFIYFSLNHNKTLTIRLNGALNSVKNASLRIKGQSCDVLITDFSKPIKIELNSNESGLNLDIWDGQRNYFKYIHLTF